MRVENCEGCRHLTEKDKYPDRLCIRALPGYRDITNPRKFVFGFVTMPRLMYECPIDTWRKLDDKQKESLDNLRAQHDNGYVAWGVTEIIDGHPKRIVPDRNRFEQLEVW